MKDTLNTLFKAIIKQDAQAMRSHFHEDAEILWHDTNEKFTVEEYLRANCEYPGNWDGEIERMHVCETTWIVVARVWEKESSLSFHVTSFYEFKNGKIIQLDEYWGNDDSAPQWRVDLKIGVPIKE